MISADLSDESAVLEAFAKTAADPELPPVGVVIFVGQRSFDGTDADDALGARARVDLGDLGYGARGRRRLAREVPAAVVGHP